MEYNSKKRDYLIEAYCKQNANGTTDTYVAYACPCGKGKITEEHIKDACTVEFLCDECKKNYDLVTTDENGFWFLCEKRKK